MNGIFDRDPREPKPSSEKPLKQIIFVQIQDSECDAIGWRYREVHSGDYGISFSSNRLFDSFDETLEAWQESRRTEP